MNKTLRKEYVIADKEAQKQFHFIFNGGKVDDINKALAYIENLPVINKTSINIRNRKGHVIARVGTKGGIKYYSTDYNHKTWYFDGNKLGKRKRLLIEAFYNDKMIDNINTDGMEKVWKKISKRVNL